MRHGRRIQQFAQDEQFAGGTYTHTILRKPSPNKTFFLTYLQYIITAVFFDFLSIYIYNKWWFILTKEELNTYEYIKV